MLAQIKNHSELKDLVKELWVAVVVAFEAMIRILAQKAGSACKFYRTTECM